VKIQGMWCYLYRAIDADGNLVDSMLSLHRDLEVATRCGRGHMKGESGGKKYRPVNASRHRIGIG